MLATPTTSFPMMAISTWDDIEKATSIKEIKDVLNSQISSYNSIDVTQAMSELSRVGTYLQLAYAGTKGFSSCSSVVKILADYQTLVKDSFAATNSFVGVSIQALKYHRFAIMIAQQDQFKKAIEMIKKTSAVAGEMATICQQLANQSSNLSELAKEALRATVSDDTVSRQKKQEIDAMINDLKAKEVSLSTKSKALAEAVAEEKEREAKAAAESKEMRQQAFTVALISSIMTPLATVAGAVASPMGAIMGGSSASIPAVQIAQQLGQLNAQITELTAAIDEKEKAILKEANEEKKNSMKDEVSTLRTKLNGLNENLQQQRSQTNQMSDRLQQSATDAAKKEVEIAKLRAATQKELRDANASLAEAVSKLQSASNQGNDLDAAICSLELAAKTLGRIVTIFGNAKLFWNAVEDHCKSLARADDTLDADLACIGPEWKTEFINSLQSSGLSWLALGKINRTANLTMRKVNNGIDGIMNNLPTKSEAATLISNLSSEVLTDLNAANNKLTQ